MQPLLVTTTVTKNLARCGVNLRDYIDKAESWNDLNNIASELTNTKCEFDYETGWSRQRIDALSGSALPSYMKDRYVAGNCFGSMKVVEDLFATLREVMPFNSAAGDVDYDAGINGWDLDEEPEF